MSEGEVSEAPNPRVSIDKMEYEAMKKRIRELEAAILQHKSVVGATDISNVEDDHILWALVEHKEGEL